MSEEAQEAESKSKDIGDDRIAGAESESEPTKITQDDVVDQNPAKAQKTEDPVSENQASGKEDRPGKYETEDWGGDKGDWRKQITGGKEDKTLERFNTPEDLYKSYVHMRQKLSSGELSSKLPENPSDEEVSEYRKEHGIPESYKDYEYSLPDGMEFGEQDQPYLEKFLEGMHNNHATPDMVDAALNAYAGILEDQAVAYVEKDRVDQENFEDEMRAEWGQEYRANKNMLENFLGSAPQDIREKIQNGRGPDGTAFLNDPSFVKWLSGMAREINPAASVIKSTGRDNLSAINDEIAKLDDEMRNDINKWHKNPEKKKRHRELLDAKMKLEARK